MTSTNKWWLAASLTLGLIVAGCAGTDDDASSDGNDADAGSDPAATVAAAPEQTPSGEVDLTDDGATAGSSTGSLVLDGEEIPIARLLCYFEEQPRAGLGGVFTHTAQGEGTNAAGEYVLVDMTRARAEDGTIEDDLGVGIGEIGVDFVEYHAGGPEGLIDFGESSAAVSGVEVADISSDTSFDVTFDLSCG